MRVAVLMVLACCLSGCSKGNPTSKQIKKLPAKAPVRSLFNRRNEFASFKKAQSTTQEAKLAQMQRIFKSPVHLPDNPPLGPSFYLGVASGTIDMDDGTWGSNAYYSMNNVEFIYFGSDGPYALFGKQLPGAGPEIVSIELNGSPTKSLLVDCSISYYDQHNPPIFQFSQHDFNSTHGTSLVTPVSGHLYYGIGPVEWPDNERVWTIIEMEVSPSSPPGSFDFDGCELTFTPAQ